MSWLLRQGPLSTNYRDTCHILMLAFVKDARDSDMVCFHLLMH